MDSEFESRPFKETWLDLLACYEGVTRADPKSGEPFLEAYQPFIDKTLQLARSKGVIRELEIRFSYSSETQEGYRPELRLLRVEIAVVVEACISAVGLQGVSRRGLRTRMKRPLPADLHADGKNTGAKLASSLSTVLGSMASVLELDPRTRAIIEALKEGSDIFGTWRRGG